MTDIDDITIEFRADIWQAMALAVYTADNLNTT